MENKLLTYILQMQKQSSTQSVPKLPKAQKGKEYVSMKNNKDWFDSRANWSNTGNPKYDSLVRESVLSGRFGFDPNTNQLVKLKESEWANVSDADKEKATATYGKKSYSKRFNSNTAAGKELRKAELAQSNKEMIKNPLFYAPAALAAAPFVAGAASAAAPILGAAMNAPMAGVAGLTGTNVMNAGFAYQAAKNLPNLGRSIKTAYQNPTLSNIGDATAQTALTTLDALPFGASVAPGVKAAVKASKESGLLSNAYKVNPFAFKPTEGMMYRGIGKEGMEDALQSGLFRAKQDVTPTSIGNFNTTRQFSKAYYSPRFDIADQYGQGFIAEVPKEASGWGKRYGTKEWSQIAQRDIPITEGKVLQKDWLKRYKEVPQPNSTQRVTRGPINYWEEPGFAKRNPNFNPEAYANSPTGSPSASRDIPEGMTPKLNWDTDINWDKWNPEIAKNEKLMDEYINIENSTKANNTWMKNSDGSKFAGTPEQFVQSRSENFKKAFPQGADVVYRGDRSHYEAIRGKGEELYGKSIFTTPDKELAKFYAYNEPTTSPYYNPNIETVEQKLQRMYGPDMTVEKLRNEHPEVAGRILETNDGGLYELAIPKTTNELTFDAGKNLHYYLSNPEVYDKLIKEGIVPHKRPEPGIFDTDNVAKLIEKTGLDRATIKNVNDGKIADVLIHNQRPGKYAKSLRGNNGMFDMTNPNIYKALIPAVGAAGVLGAQQKAEGGPIVDPRGQWAHPGKVTRIPGSNKNNKTNITMKDVKYPVLGIGSNGGSMMMYPEQEYEFNGSSYVDEYPMMGKGGEMIRRADGSYSKRGLWDNIRANKGSGKKPTKEMLEQERKIKAKNMENGGTNNAGFEALPEYVQAKILSQMGYGGYYNPYMAEGGEANGSMALGQIMAVSDKMNKLRQFISPEQNLDPWIASKLAVIDDSTAAISDYMMYNPEAQGESGEEEMGEENEQEGQEEMMANGGYVVTRSNDRKGKTHKVTGPGGVVKYFGDSKLGQHPKDPERKAAFYARHKKNLAGNPFFRAFARKTWEDGGSTFSGNAWYQDGGDYDDTNTMNSSGAYGYGYEMGGYIPDYQMAYGGAPQNYYGNQAKNFTFASGGRVGQEMEVTPQEAEMLRQQGYQFEIL